MDNQLYIPQTISPAISPAISQTISQASQKKELIENIQKWTIVDTHLKKILEKAKEYREMKTKISQSVCNYLQEHNMQNTKIDITNGQIKVHEKKDYSPLTFTYVEESLAKIIPDKSHVEYIIKYLKDNREIKTSTELRRTYKGIVQDEPV